MTKKRFRSGVADRAAPRYPSLLDDEGRRSFLRALGAGLLGAAVGALAAGCDDATNTLAGKPDTLGSRFDAAVDSSAWSDSTPDTWNNVVDGSPRPPDLWIENPDGLPSPDSGPLPELGVKDLTPGDAVAEQPAQEAGGPDDGGVRPELGRNP